MDDKGLEPSGAQIVVGQPCLAGTQGLDGVLGAARPGLDAAVMAGGVT